MKNPNNMQCTFCPTRDETVCGTTTTTGRFVRRCEACRIKLILVKQRARRVYGACV